MAYDNVAVGSVAGMEHHNPAGVTDVSQFGSRESVAAGSAATLENVAIGSSGGIEDYVDQNVAGGVSPQKLTSEGETITDTPSVD